MKVSYKWLQTYFDKPIPKPEKIAELFTMHAFELEGMEKAGDDTVFDFKILPNRAHDCLGIDGIARELSVLSRMSLKLKNQNEKFKIKETKHKLKISIEDSKLCRRYAGRIIENVSVKDSPAWLKERLESIGQRSINNVVDITNYVMYSTGQPTHAFDLDKLAKPGNQVVISVRQARSGEKLLTLDSKDIALDETMLVIADNEKPLALAGIKGGKFAEVDENTKHIILESANFEPTSTRKTSQKVGIRTDSEKRFENEITPEFAGHAMEMATGLFNELAGGTGTKIGEEVDVYPRKRNAYKIGVTVNEVNNLLGSSLKQNDIEKILKRLDFKYEIVSNPTARLCELAPKYLGVPYKYGASISYDAPDSFDCASIMSYLFSQVGFGLPRICLDQYVFGAKVNKEDIVAGDLVFAATGITKHVTRYETVEFLPGTKVLEGVDHVGLYMGNDEIIHATETIGRVVREKLSESGQFKNIVGYRRMISLDEPRFVVTVPSERLDLMSKRSFLVSGNTEDLIEEIGRVHGYEDIPSVLPDARTNADLMQVYAEKNSTKPVINKMLHYSNVVRDALADIGFSEVYTYALVGGGDIELENPMSDDKHFLRKSLTYGITNSVDMNSYNLPLLGVALVKIFEIGKVFTNDREYTSCAIGVFPNKKNPAATLITEAKNKLESVLGIHLEARPPSGGVWEFDFDEVVAKLPEPTVYVIPATSNAIFRPISQYPFALRDIAVFVPEDISANIVLSIIKEKGGNLLIRADQFDEFKKDGKVSHAFHLVFQSHEKTLSDEELNKIMENITNALNSNTGWLVR